MNILRPEYDMIEMGRKMKYYRELRGFTVEDVREYMQFSSVQAVYKWESGKCFPSADNLVALAELYQVNPIDLMPKRKKGIKILLELENRTNLDYIVLV